MKNNSLSASFIRFLLALGMVAASSVFAQSPNLAPDFTTWPSGSRLVVVPVDIELFSISGGGVREPKADWTDAAQKNFTKALVGLSVFKDSNVSHLKESDLDDLSEVNSLHGAVASSIFIHHMLGGGANKLPTKDGKLLWSLGDAVKSLQAKTQADYALFTWVRDSYASSERKAAMVVMAILGVGVAGGVQVGYASLVDLKTGQVMWFSNLLRGSGDLREEKPALETVELLLSKFPVTK